MSLMPVSETFYFRSGALRTQLLSYHFFVEHLENL